MKRLAGIALYSFLLSTVALVSSAANATETVVVLSPHRKAIPDEFIPLFKEHYKKKFSQDIQVEWLDQGGTSNDVKFLRAKFGSNPKTAGIDVFWGGPSLHFIEMARDNLLAPYPLSKEQLADIPAECAGIPLRDEKSRWHASAISSFGVFFNRPALKMVGRIEPRSWTDLADPSFYDQVALADPRNSGTNATINTIILQSLGWQKGWETITAIAGNTRRFYNSSSDPLKAVETGDVLASMIIDFYGLSKVADLGKDKVGFVLPAGQTILDSDPIALVKGAPNNLQAQRFIDFILSAQAQAVLMLPKGAPQGPKFNNLGRMAMNTATYRLVAGQPLIVPFNPFEGATKFYKYDAEKAATQSRVINDLAGAVLIDMHSDLKKAWGEVIKGGGKPETIAKFVTPIVTEDELSSAAKKWDDSIFRNKTLNAWVEKARQKYKDARSAH